MTTMETPTTTDHAEELAQRLNDTGHEVTAADLLDCLASAGLVLVREPHGAAQAYSEHILEGLEDAS